MNHRGTAVVSAFLLVVMLTSALGCRDTQAKPVVSFLELSITPSTGESKAQIFTITYSDPSGYRNLRDVRVLFNNTQDGVRACYVYYSPAEDAFRLVNDAGNASALLRPGAAGVTENGQCVLDASQSSVSGSGNDLTVRLALTFSSTFGGKKNIYLYAENQEQLSTGLVPRGTWTVPKTFLRSTAQ